MSAPQQDRPASLTVALTGGIASGKTTVANLFVERGAVLIDADLVARELVAPGQPALIEITAAFGSAMLSTNGELDRRRMRERVFADDGERRRLEAILHPRVRSELLARATVCTAPYCLIAIPLFAESFQNGIEPAYAWVDRVLVVDVPREVQLDRLTARDDMTLDGAQRGLAAQATRAQRLALADDVIDNAGAVGGLNDAVEKLHRVYLALAKRRAVS